MDSGQMNQITLETLKKIIKAVRCTPGIYNYKHNDFIILDRREQCWVNIAKTVNIGVDELKNKWRILRDRYVRYQKQILLGNITRTEVRFPFFEEMTFLDPYIKRRNRSQIRNSNKLELVHFTESDQLDPKEFQTSDTSEKFSYCDNTMATSGYHEDDDDNDNQTQVLICKDNNYQDEMLVEEGLIETSMHDNDEQKYVEQETVFVESSVNSIYNKNCVKMQRHQDYKEISYLDEDDLFGKSIGMSLKKLSRLNNVRAKIEIYKVLEKLIEVEEK